MLLELCKWLQDLQWATDLRESVWMFPLVEGTHLLALAISVGTLMIIDLRLAGFLLKQERVSEVSNRIMPWSLVGFLIMFVTGILLFASQAVKAYGSIYFRIKVVMLLLAGINALVFELTLRQSIATWDTDQKPPLRARLAGMFGMLLWAGVIAAGRTMAYNF